MTPQRWQAPVAQRAVLLAAGLLLLGILFHELVTLALAVMTTVILAIPLASFATRLERRGVPRALGALLGLVLGLAVLAGFLALIVPPLVQETKHFVDGLPATVANLRSRIHEATGASQGQIGHSVQRFADRYRQHPEKLLGTLTSAGLTAVGTIGALLLMLVTAYFMAVRPEPLVNGAARLLPPRHRADALRVMERLRDAWIGWMHGTLIKMAVVGALLYVGLRLAGLQFAVLFAVLTAVLVVIPYFGGALATIPAVLLALTDSPGKALLVFGIFMIVLQIEGNFIVPVVMAHTVKLHPALIAIGVVLVGELFGFLGLFLAIPLLSLLVILTEELWVKPMERRHERTSASAVEVAGSAAAPPAQPGTP
ncbi:MAG: AI-2E family transporter [Thermoleophilaceae bacterium]